MQNLDIFSSLVDIFSLNIFSYHKYGHFFRGHFFRGHYFRLPNKSGGGVRYIRGVRTPVDHTLETPPQVIRALRWTNSSTF
jgi:hypothetical protein